MTRLAKESTLWSLIDKNLFRGLLFPEILNGSFAREIEKSNNFRTVRDRRTFSISDLCQIEVKGYNADVISGLAAL
jgi:hypothetical protein